MFPIFLEPTASKSPHPAEISKNIKFLINLPKPKSLLSKKIHINPKIPPIIEDATTSATIFPPYKTYLKVLTRCFMYYIKPSNLFYYLQIQYNKFNNLNSVI